MLIKNFILLVISLCGGVVVAAGVFAFITMIGVFPRLAERTHTIAYSYSYETAIVAGGMAGNLITVFMPQLPIIGTPGLLSFGIFSGVFVGCLAMALAENLKVIPVLVKRTGLRYGLPWIIAALAAGKALGSFYQFYMG